MTWLQLVSRGFPPGLVFPAVAWTLGLPCVEELWLLQSSLAQLGWRVVRQRRSGRSAPRVSPVRTHDGTRLPAGQSITRMQHLRGFTSAGAPHRLSCVAHNLAIVLCPRGCREPS